MTGMSHKQGEINALTSYIYVGFQIWQAVLATMC